MWKKQLWSPVFIFNIARRVLSSNSTCIPVDTIFQIQSCATLSAFDTREVSRVFQPTGCHFPRRLEFSVKNFSSESSEKVRCWNCNAVPGNAMPFLVCQFCRCVQPVDHLVDFFQIFGLEKKYEIGDTNLEGMYKDWQKKLHPDLVYSKSEREKEYAAEQSARVIDAYRTLTNPLSRAMYIMRTEGVEVDEEQTVSEPELLAEIMEIREAVEEAADSRTLKEIQTQVCAEAARTTGIYHFLPLQ